MSGNPDKAIKILTEAGIEREDARFDIGVIFSYLGDDEKLFDEAVKKRAEGMPVAYIIGRQAFYKEEYKVTPDVLIPRADTELLVEAALQHLGALDFAAGDVASISIGSEAVSRPRILDLCTGTGCVGISVLNTLLAKKGDAEVVISDVSEAALAVASENIKEASVAPSKISAIKLDVLAEDIPEGEFDVITANPPYINRTDMDELDVEVGKFEPHLALAGGDDGLIFYPHICNIALKCLKKGGALIVEHGYDQGKQVSQTLVNKGFNNVKVLKDFGGNDRVTYGIR